MCKQILLGGLGEKTSNGGTQHFQHDRVYSPYGIATCLPAGRAGGGCLYLMEDSGSSFELTTATYINKSYRKFYLKHGRLPRFFTAHDCLEITDIAPSLTTYCGNPTKTSSICILERK